MAAQKTAIAEKGRLPTIPADLTTGKKTFSGGVHPAENKELAEGLAVERTPFPATVHIPFSQHAGAPAKPLVEKKAEVKRGEIIGEAVGPISANVHASATPA